MDVLQDGETLRRLQEGQYFGEGALVKYARPGICTCRQSAVGLPCLQPRESPSSLEMLVAVILPLGRLLSREKPGVLRLNRSPCGWSMSCHSFHLRTATCKAVNDVVVATLTKSAFQTFIVPLEALGRLSYTGTGRSRGLMPFAVARARTFP